MFWPQKISSFDRKGNTHFFRNFEPFLPNVTLKYPEKTFTRSMRHWPAQSDDKEELVPHHVGKKMTTRTKSNAVVILSKENRQRLRKFVSFSNRS